VAKCDALRYIASFTRTDGGWHCAEAAALLSATGGSLAHRIRRRVAPSASSRLALAWSALDVLVSVFASALFLTAAPAYSQPPEGASIASRPLATLTLTVFDPMGARAGGVPVIFEQGAMQDGSVFGDGLTDADGTYTVRLPGGTYVFTSIVDFFPTTTVVLTSGDIAHRDIRMRVEPIARTVTLCIDCTDEQASSSLPQSIIEELQRDREAASRQIAVAAEPRRGWEAFQPTIPASVRRLDGVQGAVIIEGVVSVDGRFEVSSTPASAHPELAKTARAALEAQEWEPAKIQGVKVASPVHVTFEFNRSGDRP
jgi:hypothetical protein